MTETKPELNVLEALVLKGVVGSVGSRKTEVTENFNRIYGLHNWVMGHYTDRVIPPAEMYGFFDASYLKLLRRRTDLVQTLQGFKDVYDIDETDITSGLDYAIQHNPKGKHLQDIAIRRAMKELGAQFKGTELLQVRSNDKVGQQFSPGRVQFPFPKLMPPSEKKDWFDENSIEAFYQRTKALFVEPMSLCATLTSITEEGFTIKQDEIEYFATFDKPFVLTANVKQPRLRLPIIDNETKSYFEIVQIALRAGLSPLTPNSDLTPTPYSVLEREIINKPIVVSFDADEATERDPLRLGRIHKSLGNNVNVTTRGSYIGIAGEMYNKAITASPETWRTQEIPGHELVSRLIRYDGLGSINELANFERKQVPYLLTISGYIPPEVFAKIVNTTEILKRIVSTDWVQHKFNTDDVLAESTFVESRPEDVFALTSGILKDGTDFVEFSANILGKYKHAHLTAKGDYNAR